MRICLLLLLACSSLFAADRPNIVWLISEDNSKHFLRLFDEHGAPTPNIEALAKHGLVFEHAFSNAPVCSVARTTLITGCYAPRIGTQYHRRSAMAPLPDGLRLFPAYLRDAGYYTTNKVKTDYNIEGKAAAWDESSNRASWRNRRDGQPFFHKQSFGTTHESSLHFPTADITGKPTQTDPSTVVLSPRHPDTPTFRYTYARYHDNIRAVDQQIGGVVEELKKDGLLEDTFIFYFGDHGGVLPGSKGYAWEAGLHVPLVVRVPEKWKHLADFAVGSRVPGFVSFMDFGPTALQLAGVAVPDQMDGKAFLGADVTAETVNARQEVLGYADRFDEKIDLVRTLRRGRYKYVRSFQPFNYDGLQNNYRYIQAAYAEWRKLYDEGKLNPVQRQFFEPRPVEALYDIESDPWETRNLAALPEQSQRVYELRNRLVQEMLRLNDLSVFPESVFVADGIADPVDFGRRNHERIERLLRISQQVHFPWPQAAPRIRQALDSSDAMMRYWALIVCSSFGEPATSLTQEIRRLAESDPHLLVRGRAIEFLALHAETDPSPAIVNVLRDSRDAIEANEILNTIVMLRDGRHRWDLNVSREDVHESIRDSENVRRRLDYLTSELGRGDRWVRQPRKRARNRRGR